MSVENGPEKGNKPNQNKQTKTGEWNQTGKKKTQLPSSRIWRWLPNHIRLTHLQKRNFCFPLVIPLETVNRKFSPGIYPNFQLSKESPFSLTLISLKIEPCFFHFFFLFFFKTMLLFKHHRHPILSGK